MPICLDATGGSLAEPGFGRSNTLKVVGTELHEQSHLLTCDVSSGHFGSRPGYREQIKCVMHCAGAAFAAGAVPAHASARRRGRFAHVAG
jgi:hypothetical protein